MRACKSCAEAKVKCHDEKPCRRCLKRGISCTPTSAGHVPARSFDERLVVLDTPQIGFQQNTGLAKDGVYNRPSSLTARSSPLTLENGPNSLMGNTITDMWCIANPFCENLQTDDTLGTFQSNLTSDMELSQGTLLSDLLPESFGLGGGWEELITTGRIRQASEAFKESLWYSISDQRWRTSGCIGRDLSSIPVDEQSEVLTRELHSSAPQRFNHFTRDDLFVTLVLYAHNQSPECLRSLRTGFPSPALLNTLVHLFLNKQDRKVDSWIHAASFQPNSLNMELTAMIVAASALDTLFSSLHQLGTNLRRILRPIILNKVSSHVLKCLPICDL